MSKEKTKPKFERLKKVERSGLLKIEQDKPIFVKIVSSFIEGTIKKKPATFVDVVDLTSESGEVKRIALPTMLKNLLSESYPENSFVNKSFEILKGEKVSGAENNYNKVEVYELLQ